VLRRVRRDIERARARVLGGASGGRKAASGWRRWTANRRAVAAAGSRHGRRPDGTLESGAHLDSQLTRRLRDALHRGLAHLQFGQVLLASIGSTAPFIGLFGTVWGIYHALVASRRPARSRSTRSPGPVGEALVMTAAGLAVAIPAVLAYNVFGKWVARCEAELEGFAHDLREMLLDARPQRGLIAWPSAASSAIPGASQPMSDINMTPLIDVMLVLLVIFIITAPLMTAACKLDLPKTDGRHAHDAPRSSRWRSTPAASCSGRRARATPQRLPRHRGREPPKYYACSMLPYPSGKLHMGHVRNYTINDMLTRFHRMKGFNVLMPMGWDAFGLPAENAAMKNKVPPAQWTYDNIAYMKGRCRRWAWPSTGAARWPPATRLLQVEPVAVPEDAGARASPTSKTQIVNWDPVDQTVLANEQVIDGRGWRTGAPVEKREIPGYYLASPSTPTSCWPTSTHLDGWPERVRLMQANWIGKSTGVRFAFTHDIRDARRADRDGRLWVFTTRADTIMGVTFCAVAAEHPLATHAARGNPSWPPSSRSASTAR
jgi:biopolymer transport protein ExbB/TolQ